MTPARVEPDMVVTLAYRLFDQDGELVDEITAAEPLEYVHGYAQIIPGLDAGLEGAAAGEERSLWLDPEQAFGEIDEGARLEIDRHDFPAAQGIAPGDEIAAEGPDGTEWSYRVIDVGRDVILVDLNHPLAGQTVRFDVEVLALRPATEEEVAAARLDADERIAHASAIVYGSDLLPPAPEQLVELRGPATRGSSIGEAPIGEGGVAGEPERDEP